MDSENSVKYYDIHAGSFVKSTVSADMSHAYDRFLDGLPMGASILDLGCGSGRDTRYFLGLGYRVTATDGSRELCRMAEQYVGQTVRCELFEDLDEKDKYEGVWACASLLHVKREALPSMFEKICRSMRKGGRFYLSFKYGDFSGERNGRYFADFTETTFHDLVSGAPEFRIEKIWISTDARVGRERERWLNAVLIKQAEPAEGRDGYI